MLAGTGRFRPGDRLLHSRDFKRVGRGRRAAGDGFVLLVTPAWGGAEHSRLGLTVSRKVGNAVVRNRVKRRVREWYRTHPDVGDRGLDLLVIARATAAELSSVELQRGLSKLLERATVDART